MWQTLVHESFLTRDLRRLAKRVVPPETRSRISVLGIWFSTANAETFSSSSLIKSFPIDTLGLSGMVLWASRAQDRPQHPQNYRLKDLCMEIMIIRNLDKVGYLGSG